jgi:hypothetical protein
MKLGKWPQGCILGPPGAIKIKSALTIALNVATFLELIVLPKPLTGFA